MESRPFARGAVPRPREGLQGPTGPGGWGRGTADAPAGTREGVGPPTHTPPTPAPWQGLPGPAPLGMGSWDLSARWLVYRYYPPWYPPVLPTLYTHLVPPTVTARVTCHGWDGYEDTTNMHI